MSAKRTKSDKKMTLIEYLSTKTSLPSDLISGGFRLEVRGRNLVIGFGCKRILKYTPSLIIIAARDFSVGIFGERLVCTTYHEGAICIEGHIEKAEFDPCIAEGE